MKKNYSKFLFIAMLAFGLKANAQCTSCTTTISGLDAANHIVSSGQTMCITSTGIATGLITVASGGTLCNQGRIKSTDLWVAGGTYNNYGIDTTTRVLVSAQGVFNNYNKIVMDSLLVTNIYSSLTNTGTISGLRLAFSDYSSGINNGDVTVGYLGDSAASYTNNHNTTINFDLLVGYSSGCFNYGYMKIMRDFFNSFSSTFETNCMITVGRDWYNSAIVLGPSTGSCGGFNIAGVSASSGTIGNSSTHIDLCDAGHPGTGIDGPGGTIATTTTYCTCANNCAVVMGIAEQPQSNVLIQKLYPNPATSNITIELEDNTSEQLEVEVMDMMGRKCFSTTFKSTVGSTRSTIDVSKLSQGAYILKITDSKQLQSKQLFNVVK